MPLKEGYSAKTTSSNIREMMNSYDRKGSIGNTTPRNRKHAQKIAVAASMAKKGYSTKKKR